MKEDKPYLVKHNSTIYVYSKSQSYVWPKNFELIIFNIRGYPGKYPWLQETP